ncbi:hypothetical protein A3B40_03695 [Candidatus Roizmanbacteria bacterium RIFCSPLOWO2_01_FULL_37_16]|uniref:alanine--tRNA ligase n=1 Tax=Candidatus Roizmanbacteria bacterium RIFCSPLOWO2_01_FULL_37_16 TaxID=1802058 RepID=A0A1F7ILL9_9BACT|nr:MAG: hypothetical protein A3B40_03695 [Candidatus Roizmanbacteria bacterium RIFCSPLOWO2_01_FULL_37_16]
MNVDLIEAWLNYYQSKGFRKIQSAPLIHPLFPTSFNMSAGIVQLDAKIRSPKKITSHKECLVQKCFRHFDISKVGDNTHLSFFEMATSFEIGNANEEIAINDLWRFLTDNLTIDEKKLWITTFSQDRIANKPISLSKKLLSLISHIAKKRVIYGSKETNFWQQGGGTEIKDNIRLCGPQIELYYDLGSKLGCQKKDCNPLDNCGRFLEIANTISIKYFIDYNQEPKLKNLVNPSTETVIGIERVAQILENKTDIFETLFFQPLTSQFSKSLNKDIKIICDHLKGLIFIFAEAKIEPGRNYRKRIVRTLIRELLTSFYILRLKPKDYLAKLISEAEKIYKERYPEVIKARRTLISTIFEHEVVFQKTLEKGANQIKKYLKENNIKKIGDKEKQFFRNNYGIPTRYLPLIFT